MLDNIIYGLQLNVESLNNIYASLIDISNFAFYKLYPVVTAGSGNYITTGTFQTNSLIISPPASLNDNYSNNFTPTPIPGKPSDVNQPFGNYVNSQINSSNGIYHTTNTSAFNNTLFTPYFAQIVPLWSKTDTYNSIYTPPADLPLPPLMYFMNYLWFYMASDMPSAVSDFLHDTYQNDIKRRDPSTIFNAIVLSTIDTIIVPFLQGVATEIINVITPKITNASNFTTENGLNNLKATTGTIGDIILFGIVKPGETTIVTNIESGLGNLTIPEYIVARYEKALNDLIPLIPTSYSHFPDSTLNQQQVYVQFVQARLIGVVNLFLTPLVNIPTYTNYLAQNSNIYANRLFQINMVLMYQIIIMYITMFKIQYGIHYFCKL